jgi:hypothetical protein
MVEVARTLEPSRRIGTPWLVASHRDHGEKAGVRVKKLVR